MGKFVGVSVVIFALAVVLVIVAQRPEMAALLAGFRSEPAVYKIAWAVIVLVPLCMLPFGVYLWSSLTRQRQTNAALEQRLDGVRSRVKDLTKAQLDADRDVQQLTRSDPEDAVAALQRRVSESERFAEIQRSRNEMVDLDTRVGAVRDQQQALKDRLAPMLERRHAIEHLFTELDTRQRDIERALAEIASGDDGTALDLRLKNLGEFVRQSNARCDQIEYASKMLATLNEACAELLARLNPFAAADDGIANRLRRLVEQRDVLTAGIEALERMPGGMLSDQVQKLTEDRKRLDDGVSQLNVQFGRLAALRKDTGNLFAGLERALGAVSTVKTAGGDGAGIDARIGDVARFVEQTRSQFDEIERRVTAFEGLRGDLGDLQSRLAPLESEESGVVTLITELHEIRERLIGKIRHIEGGEAGDLAARVNNFAEAKQELEDRVANLADQFTKLSTIRKDIAGLFDKLSSAVGASAT